MLALSLAVSFWVAAGCGGPDAHAREAVAAPPSLRVRAAPAVLAVQSLLGSPSPELLIELTREAGGALAIPDVHVTYDPPVASWLTFTIAGDDQKRTTRVRAVPFQLSERPGVYAATLEFAFRGADASAVCVPVSLQVTASSGAVCPRGSTLRYDGGGDAGTEPSSFGRRFFAAYCTRCHAAALRGPARNGAPPGLNWDELSTVRAHLGWIDRAAAAGPNGVHSDMPPSALVDTFPSDADRRRLGTWIACGAP